MAFDYRKLRGKIKEAYGTQDDFAMALGIGRVSLSQRLNNLLDFSQEEIYKSCNILSIKTEEIPTYFFVKKVQKQELSTEKNNILRSKTNGRYFIYSKRNSSTS